MLFKDFLYYTENKISLVRRKESLGLFYLLFDFLHQYEWPRLSFFIEKEFRHIELYRKPEDIIKLDFEFHDLEVNFFAWVKTGHPVWALTEEESELLKKCFNAVYYFIASQPYPYTCARNRKMVAETFNFLFEKEKIV